jgi:hypothetical protein
MACDTEMVARSFRGTAKKEETVDINLITSRRVEIDDSKNHPTIVFVQDAETFFTLALRRSDGRIIGYNVGRIGSDMEHPARPAVWREAFRTQDEIRRENQ